MPWVSRKVASHFGQLTHLTIQLVEVGLFLRTPPGGSISTFKNPLTHSEKKAQPHGMQGGTSEMANSQTNKWPTSPTGLCDVPQPFDEILPAKPCWVLSHVELLWANMSNVFSVFLSTSSMPLAMKQMENEFFHKRTPTYLTTARKRYAITRIDSMSGLLKPEIPVKKTKK